jgi:hypothetical protein
MTAIRNNPVVVGILTLIAATVTTLAAFGVELTDEQVNALRTLAEAAVVLAFYIRSRVTPTK